MAIAESVLSFCWRGSLGREGLIFGSLRSPGLGRQVGYPSIGSADRLAD